jgi:hypothetical protein
MKSWQRLDEIVVVEDGAAKASMSSYRAVNGAADVDVDVDVWPIPIPTGIDDIDISREMSIS